MSRYAEAHFRTQSDIVREAFPDIVQPVVTVHETSLDARVLRILVAMPAGERHRDYLTRDDARAWLQSQDQTGFVAEEAVDAFLNSRKEVLTPIGAVHDDEQAEVDSVIRRPRRQCRIRPPAPRSCNRPRRFPSRRRRVRNARQHRQVRQSLYRTAVAIRRLMMVPTRRLCEFPTRSAKFGRPSSKP